MMPFILLTNGHDDSPVYINVAQIVQITDSRDKRGGSIIYYHGDDCQRVKESAEVIVDAIQSSVMTFNAVKSPEVTE